MESGELSLHMSHLLPAPRPIVFGLVTDPRELQKWWGPNGFTTPSAEVDLRVGGAYRFAMQPPEGELFYLSGEFVKVDPPAVVAYTFRWEDPDPDDRETVVTLALEDRGESTEVTFTQGVFATEARRVLHHDGWTDGFEKLHRLLSTPRE